MAAFHHGPNETGAPERAETISRNSRYGLVLFTIYLVLYGAFVLTNAFSPELMERTPIAGVNVAILSGFALIGIAFLLALVYGWLCRAEAPSNGDSAEEARS